MGDMSPEFATKDEEIAFWKSLAQDLKIRLTESRDELDEFQENSRELEAELEAQLEQQEARVKELTSRLARVQTENDQIKEKLELLQNEAHHEISDLQTGLSEVTSIKDKLAKYIRELEQENDDLERIKRTMVVSLEDFEGRLNQALERNAFLESELDEKETLREMVQRLKDESRDLRQELVIRGRHETDEDEPDNERSAVDSNKRLEDCPETVPRAPASSAPQTSPAAPAAALTAKVSPVGGEQPSTNGHVSSLDGGRSMTPSSRISALNIVGDLLRKVGEKLELLQNEAHHEISDLQTGLSEVTSIKDKLAKYIRELEQENDDLERIKRTMVVSLEDFEGRLNQALERNAFLESELDEKETLREMVQRLKDESRDLRQELVIRGRHETDEDEPDNERSAVDSNKRLEDCPETVPRAPASSAPQTSPAAPAAALTAKVSPVGGEQPSTNGHVSSLDGGRSMTPSSRISALNIVGDLLRKVGALESKLASCKSYVKDNPRPHTGHGQQVGRDLHRVKPRKVVTKIPTQVQR